MSPTFQDEVQLAGWSETHTGGAKVTFWLPDTAALDVFRTLTARKGNTAGHRFACVLVEIGDDEMPVQPEADAVMAGVLRPKGGEWAKLAGMWCADRDFWEWAKGLHLVDEVASADEAAMFVRDTCGIGSRSELDHDAEALARFNERIRWPFMRWMQARGISK